MLLASCIQNGISRPGSFWTEFGSFCSDCRKEFRLHSPDYYTPDSEPDAAASQHDSEESGSSTDPPQPGDGPDHCHDLSD